MGVTRRRSEDVVGIMVRPMLPAVVDVPRWCTAEGFPGRIERAVPRDLNPTATISRAIERRARAGWSMPCIGNQDSILKQLHTTRLPFLKFDAFV